MINRQIRSRIAKFSILVGSQKENILMKEQVEISETKSFFTDLRSTHTVDMDVDSEQAALFFAEGGKLDEEIEYLRLKRAEKKAIRVQKLKRLKKRERQN